MISYELIFLISIRNREIMDASSIECNILLISIMNKTVLKRMETNTVYSIELIFPLVVSVTHDR